MNFTVHKQKDSELARSIDTCRWQYDNRILQVGTSGWATGLSGAQAMGLISEIVSVTFNTYKTERRDLWEVEAKCSTLNVMTKEKLIYGIVIRKVEGHQ